MKIGQSTDCVMAMAYTGRTLADDTWYDVHRMLNKTSEEKSRNTKAKTIRHTRLDSVGMTTLYGYKISDN